MDDFDAFVRELEGEPSPTVGEVLVFVDECHRTQSGKLHRVMRAIMPDAVFVGFTGTPLLKRDAQTSMEVFGSYIHTYKFSEGVEDGVVLDLVYDARDIDQRLGSEEKIDAWFDAKTKGLNDWQRGELKKQWGTVQKVRSSRSRMDRVVADMVFDFAVRPRLSSERGNAILVAPGIYEACKYFSLFQETALKGRCAVVTSYSPQAGDVALEETGENTETEKQFIYQTYNELLAGVDANPGMTKTETYDEWAKALFTKEPANMRLLVVVDKLLTGFDAPPCTYLYIDKSMQDHGLFQAICRVNRLDGDDKDFGYIVDYKDLFGKVEDAMAVYTSQLDHSAGGPDPQVLLRERLMAGKERLDGALEALALLCEPVRPPEGELEHIHYFCGNTEVSSDLGEREPLRAMLYKATVALARAYAAIADELEPAGYSSADMRRIDGRLKHYLNVREVIRKASGETLDTKAYEADMRHLIDTYIEADEPRKISPFDGMGLLELIAKSGIADAVAKRLGELKGNESAIAETIENNVRRTIIKEHLSDPAFYEKMSSLLDGIIAERRAKAVEYEEYLNRIAELATRVEAGHSEETPATLDTPGKRALYNNLGQDDNLALAIDDTVKRARPDAWRGVRTRENTIKASLLPLLDNDQPEVETGLRDHQRAARVLMATRIELGDVAVDVVRKDIKNVHLSVYPPTGRVRVSAPQRMSIDTIRAFALSKLDWIKQQQSTLQAQERETPRDYLNQESHYLWGTRRLLTVSESDQPPSIKLEHNRMLLQRATGNRPGQARGSRRGVVSRAAQRGRAAAARALATAAGRER